MRRSKKMKTLFLIVNIMVLLFTVALLPLNLFVHNFPAWIVAFFGFIAVAGTFAYLILFQTKFSTKIIFSLCSILLAAVSSFTAFSIPYWNSYVLKPYEGTILNYDDTLTYQQAKNDLDEAVFLLERIHPMFQDGLTAELQERHAKANEHLAAISQITVNDLRREIQWLLNPMHDAHTSTYSNYPRNQYLKDAVRKSSEGYTLISVNGLAGEQLDELAKLYCSYETERNISMNAETLADLDFYGFSPPYTFVWENNEGIQMTEQYTKDDFVSFEEYMAIRDFYADDNQTEGNPFVYYEIDEGKSLAVLTLTQCNAGDAYNECVEKMFTEIKEKSIQNVAVDLRGNPGGNSGVANEFIRYLPTDTYMESPCDWRWNFFSFHDDGKRKNDRCTELIFTGNVYILTDQHSFSSAMLFPLMIQDNGLGYVIGESPDNSANSYGDITYFYLKESGLYLQISTKKFYRINPQNPSDYIIPDFPCNGKDIFKKLYEVIAK